ncbi:CDP-glycerol glycerophosphotransferase family protein, partial [Enterococcus saccharolyticus]|uniref:CDP-glycerol glycerophosphotransferase family protein n=1 Tax=Enterococcus saccharolyticus TaxID=41997 RepID=UPI001E5070E1
MSVKELISRGYRIGFNLISKLNIKKDTVVFESFNGKVPCDNPLAIYLEYIQLHPEKQNKCYWSIKKEFVNETKKQYPELQIIKRFSLKWMLLLPRANFWVFNSRLPIWLKKNKKTIYVQTWHGTPLKKLGLDIENVSISNIDSQSYKSEFVREAQRWDYLIAQNSYSADIFRQAFAFKNEILEIGYPRNDKLVNLKNNVRNINFLRKKYFKQKPLEGKVILYAPTWRDDFFIRKGVYKFNLPFNLEDTLSYLGELDKIIIRPHYLVKDSINIDGYEDRVIIASDADINELYLISDLLITDYSSVMFDYAILEKPMLFFAYDYDYYKDKLRGFYFEYDNVPGPIVKDKDEFYNKIKEFKIYN